MAEFQIGDKVIHFHYADEVGIIEQYTGAKQWSYYIKYSDGRGFWGSPEYMTLVESAVDNTPLHDWLCITKT